MKTFKVKYPWDSREFHFAWIEWRTYRKEKFNKHYKNQLSEQGALNALKRMSRGNQEHAIKILNNTIKKEVLNFVY